MSMLSLGDQILKFDKLAQTLQSDTMTLDQRFMGGGLTIQDLLQENNYIITQMRKMKDVFLNYCKLNQKVYTKILDHENTASEQMKKIITAESNIDKKIKGIADDFNLEQQKLIKNHKKDKQQTQQIITIIRKQLQNKVSEQGFSDRIKSLIQEYDCSSNQSQTQQPCLEKVCENNQNNPSAQSPNENTQKVQSDQLKTPTLPKKKRGGGLTIDDINRLKNEITPLIDIINDKIQKQEVGSRQMGDQVQKNRLKLKKIQVQVTNNDENWRAQTRIIQQRFEDMKEADRKIINLLNQTINEEIWRQRLQNFHVQILKPQFTHLVAQISSLQLKNKEDNHKIYEKFTHNSQIIAQINKKITNNQKIEQQLKLAIDQTNQKLQKCSLQTDQQLLNLKDFINQTNSKSFTQFHKMLQHEAQKRSQADQTINQKIGNIVQTTQVKVLKKIQIRFSKQLKQIRNDIVDLNKKIGQIKNKLFNNISEVSNVKDVVSKKANFTDLVGYLDKKVDKTEYKQIQCIINSPSGSINGHQIHRQSTPNRFQSKSTNKMRTRKSSYLKASSQDKKYYDENSKKIFEFGLDFNQDPNNEENKKSLLNNIKMNMKSRHRTQRPSTANTIFLM